MYKNAWFSRLLLDLYWVNINMYSIYTKNPDREAQTNSVDPDLSAPKEWFDLGLHSLSSSQY